MTNMISESSSGEKASTKDALCRHRGQQCRICPQLGKISFCETLLKEDVGGTLLVCGKRSGNAVDGELPRQEDFLSKADGQHAKLPQSRTCVCQSTCLGAGIAVASIFRLADLQEQWMKSL